MPFPLALPLHTSTLGFSHTHTNTGTSFIVSRSLRQQNSLSFPTSAHTEAIIIIISTQGRFSKAPSARVGAEVFSTVRGGAHAKRTAVWPTSVRQFVKTLAQCRSSSSVTQLGRHRALPAGGCCGFLHLLPGRQRVIVSEEERAVMFLYIF